MRPQLAATSPLPLEAIAPLDLGALATGKQQGPLGVLGKQVQLATQADLAAKSPLVLRADENPASDDDAAAAQVGGASRTPRPTPPGRRKAFSVELNDPGASSNEVEMAAAAEQDASDGDDDDDDQPVGFLQRVPKV